MLAVDADTAALERLASECSAIGALSGHPNIVTVYGLGMDDDGRPFIVMEVLPGGSLADRLAGEGPLDWQQVVAIGVKLAGTLESAHRFGVLHCDVKPENVLLTRFGELRLVDFGVAQVLGASGTGRKSSIGTPGHAAPEVLRGEPPSPMSEIYSLASLLVTLLSGRPPFTSPGQSSLVRMATDATAGAAPDLGLADVPDHLRSVLEGALAADPADRPSDAARFGRQLQAVQASQGLTITPLPVEQEEPPSTAAPPVVQPKRGAADSRRRWGWWASTAGRWPAPSTAGGWPGEASAWRPPAARPTPPRCSSTT